MSVINANKAAANLQQKRVPPRSSVCITSFRLCFGERAQKEERTNKYYSTFPLFATPSSVCLWLSVASQSDESALLHVLFYTEKHNMGFYANNAHYYEVVAVGPSV